MPKTSPRKSAPKHTKNAASPVAALRHELHMTQAQFAAAMGVSYEAVSKWERGLLTPSRTAEILMSHYRRHPHLVQEASRDKAPQSGNSVPRSRSAPCG